MDARNAQKAEPQGAERRRHTRFPCEGHAEVVCRQPSLLFRGRVRDISMTGCFIETAARLRLERLTEVQVRFTASGQQVSSAARVMDIRFGKGVGFEFLPGDNTMQHSILKLIESLNDADPRTVRAC